MMSKAIWSVALLATLLGSAATAQEIASTGTTQPRLTVFEGFFNPGCGVCAAAASAVEQLATQYASDPVVFLEDAIYGAKGDRITRYQAVGNAWYFPFIMVNSGRQHAEGPQTDFLAKYKGMVDAEKSRVALVEVSAWHRRVGNAVKLYVDVRNTTSATLGPNSFPTFAHGIVWEATKVAETNRYVRAALASAAPVIGPGGRAGFTLETAELTGVDWDKLHTLAIVDYKPGGITGSTYDILQAAHAQPAAFSTSTTEMSFTFPGSTPSAQIRFAGPHVLQWSASSDRPWLDVAPRTGPLASAAVVTIDESFLHVGEQTGTLTFAATSADGMSFSAEVEVAATLSTPPRLQELPGVASAPGANQTVWRSSAMLFNPLGTPITAQLAIVPRDGATVAAAKQISLAPGEMKAIPNLYEELTAPSGAGTLRVTGEALVWVRTFNEGESGTFGQDLVGTAETVFEAGNTVVFPIITAANTQTDFRSNLLLLNLEDEPLEVTLRSGSASKVLTVPPRTYKQYDRVGQQQLGLAAGNAILSVQANGKWVGYVSTVDPVTGDPTTVRGQKLPAP